MLDDFFIPDWEIFPRAEPRLSNLFFDDLYARLGLTPPLNAPLFNNSIF